MGNTNIYIYIYIYYIHIYIYIYIIEKNCSNKHLNKKECLFGLMIITVIQVKHKTQQNSQRECNFPIL